MFKAAHCAYAPPGCGVVFQKYISVLARDFCKFIRPQPLCSPGRVTEVVIIRRLALHREVMHMAPAQPRSSIRTALVTGAGSGIGRAVAVALARNGWAVAMAGRRLQQLEEAAKEGGAHCIPMQCDTTDEASVDALFARIAAEFGRLDLLFNNAGIASPPAPLDQTSPATWRSVIDTNVTGTFLCTRAAFSLMRQQAPRGGRSSLHG